MNALEVSASPILKLLIEGQFETGQWDSQTSAIVARWAFKTALMANGGANYRRLIPPAHFHEFHQTQEVPRHVVVDVALADAPKIELCWGQSQVRGVERLTFDTSFRPEHRANSYNVVLSLKHLLLRVCYWPHDVCVVFPNHDGQFHRIRPYAANVPFNFTKHRTTLEHLIIGRIIYDRI